MKGRDSPQETEKMELGPKETMQRNKGNLDAYIFLFSLQLSGPKCYFQVVLGLDT